MDKAQYLEIRNGNGKDNLPVLFYFANLRGLRGVHHIDQFGAYFHQWVMSIMFHPGDLSKLKKIYAYVYHELDKHFNVNQ